MLRRSYRTRSSSRNDDEVGGLQRAIPRPRFRAADLQEEPTKRVATRAGSQIHRFVGSDEDGGFRRASQRAARAIRHSERSERSNQGSDSPRRICLARTGRPSVATIKTSAQTAPTATTVH